MDIRRFLRIILTATGVAAAAAQQLPAPGQESPANGILRMSEAEQVAYTNSVLDRGMQVDETETLVTLVLTRSSLVLPMLEKKIEEVLRSPSPLDCFTDKNSGPA